MPSPPNPLFGFKVNVDGKLVQSNILSSSILLIVEYVCKTGNPFLDSIFLARSLLSAIRIALKELEGRR